MTPPAIRGVRLALGAACIGPIVLAVLAFGRPVVPPDSANATRQGAVRRAGPTEPWPDSVAHLAITMAPFRLDRRPPVATYDPDRVDPAVGAPVVPPKPVLVLVGVIEGPHPAALVDGIPGREGSTLIALGSTVAGLTLRRVIGARAVISGLDTNWSLTVRNPWR